MNTASTLTALDLKDALDQMKRGYFQGTATHAQLVGAAEAYRAAIARLKAAQPTRYSRLAVPAVAKLLR